MVDCLMVFSKSALPSSVGFAVVSSEAACISLLSYADLATVLLGLLQ